MKYGELTWGQSEALVNQLGGLEVVRAILSGVLTVKVVCHRAWASLLVGTDKTPDECRQMLEATGCKIGKVAGGVLNMINFGGPEENVSLVAISVAQMGFAGSTDSDKVFARASEMGMEECQPRDWPTFRISNYGAHPWKQDIVLMGTRPIPGPDGKLYWLRLERHDKESWLSVAEKYAHEFCGPDTIFIFRLKAKS